MLLILKDENRKKRKIELVSAIADLIAAFTVGVSPFVVSGLIFKEGIYSLCEERI